MYYGGVVKSGVHACLSRRRSRVRIPSSPPTGQIAQSVEHLSEKQGVGSSILPLATMINKIKYWYQNYAPMGFQKLMYILKNINETTKYAPKINLTKNLWDTDFINLDTSIKELI